MTAEFGLVGGDWRHTTDGHTGLCTTHGKISELWKWDYENKVDSIFYIDEYIYQGLSDDKEDKYGWLVESKYVSPPQMLDHIKNNYEEYFNSYVYIFTHSKDLLDLDSRFKFVPATGTWIKDIKICDKSKMISMISSSKNFTDGHEHRLMWVEDLKDDLDLFGREFNPIDNKEDGLCDYMFSVAIENGEYETYFTEKVLDCFATGTVPIYCGAPDIDDHFNSDGIIFLNSEFDVSDLSEELYFSKMDAIKDNLERVKAMEIPEDYIWNNYL